MESVADIVAQIRENHRRREDMLRPAGNLTRQIKSLCRRVSEGNLGRAQRVYKILAGQTCKDAEPGDDALALMAGGYCALHLPVRARFEESANLYEKELRRLAKLLPVYSFVEDVPGFSALGLAQIVAEAGDLSRYDDKSKLWKRMGLGLVGGERQRKVTDKATAMAMGYAPRRRALMHVLGDVLYRKRDNLYRADYDREKARQAALHPELTKMHVHRRALRHMEKMLLRDLWRAWRDQSGIVFADQQVSVSPGVVSSAA